MSRKAVKHVCHVSMLYVHVCIYPHTCVQRGVSSCWCLCAWPMNLVGSLFTAPLLRPSLSTATVRSDGAPAGPLGTEGGCGDRGWLRHRGGPALWSCPGQLLLRCPGHPGWQQKVSRGEGWGMGRGVGPGGEGRLRGWALGALEMESLLDGGPPSPCFP